MKLSNLPLDGKMRTVLVKTAVLGLIGGGLFFGQEADRSWKDYGGGPENNHFFSGTQINKSNVSKLKLAWFYPYATIGASPVVVDNVVYLQGRNGSLIALDATTGKELWIHDGLQGMEARGLNYWESKDRKDRRIIVSINSYLQEIDAVTGKSITSFGDNGVVNLRVGLGRDPETLRGIQSGTPGKVFENYIILGSATGEGYISPPGDVRAYDILTGKLAWQFHTIPHPGEPGYETNPKDAWKYLGGVNTWGELTVDPVRGIAFFPTGSATYDFYGADRIGKNLYANCLLAIDIKTGKLKWYYQMVHHDLWDYDNVAAPQLTTVTQNGKKIDVVAQAGKTGFLYVFERETGKPLWPIEERKVPASDMPGEKAWPTQPFPTLPPPFARQRFKPDDVNPFLLTPEQQQELKDRLMKAKDEGLYTPPGLTDTVQMPGNHGGANWGSTAANPTDGTVYVHSLDVPAIIRLAKSNPGGGRGGAAPAGPAGPDPVFGQPGAARGGPATPNAAAVPGATPGATPDAAAAAAAAAAGGRGGGGGRGGRGGPPPPPPAPGILVASGPAPGAPQQGAAAGGRGGAAAAYPEGVEQYERYNQANSQYGLLWNAIKPPYSRLTAYDLNKGSIKWQIGVGDEPQTAALGIHNSGTPMLKATPLPTATGLVFVVGGDGFVRAYDADTGEALWAGRTSASTRGVPAMASIKGRQYLIVESGGASAPDARVPADAPPAGMFAFALPE